MNLKDISDDELFSLALEENEDAKKILINRYQFIINFNINKYKVLVKKYNIDYKELKNIALFGLNDALNCYRLDRETALPTFINICVERRIKNYFRKILRNKDQLSKNSYSLDYILDEDNNTYLDYIKDFKFEPLEEMMKRENLNEIIKELNNSLSKLERKVYNYLVRGYNYKQIAVLLNKTPKQIDNAMQRIKNKIKIINKAKSS